MRKLTLFLAAGALVVLSACTTSKPVSAAKPSKSVQMPQHFTFKPTPQTDLQYLLFLPEGYEAKGAKKWPLILFLHGAGERGTNIWKVTTHGPPKCVTETPLFPFIVVSPQCPEGRLWSNESLIALLDEVSRKYAVDKSRIYLTGLSMGGFGTWSLGLEYPERFAAIAPICGGGEWVRALLASRDKPEAFKSLAIWAFHGGKDDVVPVTESQRMVETVKKFGVQEVKLTIYPEATHNSWTQTYNSPLLYQWFLEHERK